MHPDAKARLEQLVATAEPRTVKARIRAMAAEIRAARAAGIPWADICKALDVRRSTLLTALRGYEPPLPRATDRKGGVAAPVSTPSPPSSKTSKVRKWGASD